MVAKIPHNIKPVEDEKPIDLSKILVSPGLEAQMAKDLTLDFSLPKATASSGTSGTATSSLSCRGYRGSNGTKVKAPTKKELEAMAAEEQARKEAQFQAFIVDKIKAYTPVGYDNHTSKGIEELRDRFFHDEYMPTVEEMSKDENGVVDNARLQHYLQLWQGYNDKKRGLVNGISNAFDQDIMDKKAEEDESLTIFNAISNFFGTQVATKGSAAIRGMYASAVNTLAKAGNILGIVDDDTVDMTAQTVAETKKGEEAKIDEAVQGNYRSKFNYMRGVERALDGRDSAIDSLLEQPFTTVTDAIGESALPMIGGIALGGGVGLGARALGMGAARAAGLGTAFGGGTIGAASVTNQAQYDILDKSDDEIKETEEYQTKLQELKNQHPDWDDKRADDEASVFIPKIRNSMVTKASVPSTISGFVTGAALSALSPVEALAGKLASGSTGKVLGKAFGSSGAAGRAIKGVGLEAVSEGIEEGLEQLQSNMAVNYATGKPLTDNAWDGVVDSAIMGAVSGGPMGATGAFHKGDAPNAQAAQGIGGDGEETSVDGVSAENSGGVQNGRASGASGASIYNSNNNNSFLSAAGQRHATANAQNTNVTNGLIRSAHDGSASSAGSASSTQSTGSIGAISAGSASGLVQTAQGTPSSVQTSPQVSGSTVQVVPDATTLNMDATVKPFVSGSFLPSSNPTAAVDVNSNEYKSAVSNLAQALNTFGLSKKAAATVIKGITDNAQTVQDFNNSVNSLLYSYIRGASNANTGQSSGTGNTANSPATPAGQTGTGQTQTAGTQGAQGNSGATPGAGSVGAARPNTRETSGNIQSAQPNGNGTGQGTNGRSGGQSNAGTGSQPNTGNGSNAGSGVQQSGNANGAAATGSNTQPGVNGVREKDLDLEQRLAADVAASCGNAVNSINAFVESELNNVKKNNALKESLRTKAECGKKAATAKTKLEKTLGMSLPNEFQDAISDILYNYVEIHNSVCEPNRRISASQAHSLFSFNIAKDLGLYHPSRNIDDVKIIIDVGGKHIQTLIADGTRNNIPSNQIAEEITSSVIKTLMHELQHSIAFEIANGGSTVTDLNAQLTTNQQKARELLQNLTARAVQLTQDANSTIATNKNLVSQTHTGISHIATSHSELLTTALEMALNDPDKFVQSKIFDTPSKKKDFIHFVTKTYKAIYQLFSRLLGNRVGNTANVTKERNDADTYGDYRALYAQAMLASESSVDNQLYKNLVRNFGYMWSLSTYNPLVAMQRMLGDASGVNKVDGSESVLSNMFNGELENVSKATQQYLAANNINQPVQHNTVYNAALKNCIKRMMPNIDAKSLDMLVNAFGVDENMRNERVVTLWFEQAEDGTTANPYTSLSDISGQLGQNVFGITPGELEANFASKYDKNITKILTDPLNLGLPVTDVVDTAIDKTVTDTIKEIVQEIDSTTGDRLDLDNVDKRQEMYLDAYNNAAEALNAYADKKTDNNLLDAIDAVAVVESMNDTDTDYSDNDMLFNSQRSLDEIIEATEFTAAMNSPYENRLDMDDRTTLNNDVIPQKTDEQKVEEILNDSDEIISGISDGYENPDVGENIANTDEFKNTYDGPVDENGNPKIQYIEAVDGEFRIVQEDTGADAIIPVYINADGSFQSINQKNVMPYDKLSAGIGAWTGLDAAHQAGESLNLNKQLHILKSNAAATGVKMNQYMRKATQIRSTFADRQAYFRTWTMTHMAQTDGTASDMNTMYQPYVHLPSAMRGAKAEVSELVTNPRVQSMEALCAPIMQAKGITSRTDTREFVSQMTTRFGMYQTLMHTIESSYKQENDIQQQIIDIHKALTDAANNDFADWYADHIKKTGVPPSPTDMQNKMDALYLQRDKDFLDNTQKLRKDLDDLRLQQAQGQVTHNKNIIAPFGGRTRIECVNEISNLISELGQILPQGVDARQFLEQGHAVINQEVESMIKMAAEKGLIDDEWIATFGDFDYYCPLTVQQNKDANALDHKGITGARVDYARQGSHTPAQDAVSALTAMEGRFARNIATADFGQAAVYFYEQLNRGVKQAEVVHDGAYGIKDLKSYDGFVVIPAGKLNQLREQAVIDGDAADLAKQFSNIANNLMYVNTNVMTISDDIYQTDASGNPVGKPLFKKGTIISTQDQIQDLENFFGMKYEDMLGQYVHSENGGYYVGFDLNAGDSLKDANGNDASPEEKAKYGADLKNVHTAFHSIMEAGDVSKSRLLGMAAFVTNSMAQMYTTFNVFFAPKNAIKDTKERLTYVTSRNYRGADGSSVSGFKVGVTMRKKLLSPAWYWRMTKAVWTKGKLANPNNDPKIARANELAKVFIYKGVGSTSNIQTMFEHQANLLANDLHSDEFLGAFSAEDRGFIKRNWARFVAVFRRWSEAWYAIPAMAQMEAMTENGITDDDAVFHTKSLMNLDQKGTFMGRSFMRALFPFTSSISQGALQHTYALTSGIDMGMSTNRGAAVKQICKSIGVMAYCVAKYTFMIQLAMLCMSGDDEEDKARRLETILKDDAAPLILGDDLVFNMPVSFGPEKMAWSLAKDMFKMSRGHIDLGSAAANILSSYIHNIAPMGNPQFDFKSDPFTHMALTLTGGSPILYGLAVMGTGKNAFGSSLEPKYTRPGDRRSDYYSIGMNKGYIEMAQFLYNISGGHVDVTPAEIKTLANTYLAGPPRAIVQVFEAKNNPLRGTQLDKTKGGPVMSAFGATSLYDKITTESYLEITRAENYYNNLLKDAGVADALKGKGIDGTNASKRQAELFRMGFSPREVEDYLLLANYQKESTKLTGEYKRRMEMARAVNNEGYEIKVLTELARQQQLLMQNTIKNLYYYDRNFKRRSAVPNQYYAQQARQRAQVSGD